MDSSNFLTTLVFAFLSTTALAQPAISDCGLAGFVCGDTVIQGASMSQGIVADLSQSNRGCFGFGENAGNRSGWFMFTAATAGTIGCFINGSVPLINLDLAIWGPYADPVCPPPTPPIRCTWYYNPGGSNGLYTGSTDTVEYAIGDGGLRALDVQPGQTYVMAVLQSGTMDNNVSVIFNLVNGATLDCTPPSVLTGLPEGTVLGDPQVQFIDACLRISNVENAQVLVTDALGRVVHSAGISGAATISTAGWSAGQYLIVISEDGSRSTRSIAVVD